MCYIKSMGKEHEQKKDVHPKNTLAFALLVIAMISWFQSTPVIASETPPQPIPIFLYHHIRNVKERWSVSPSLFEEEVKYLFDYGYHSVAMDAYENAVQNHTELPKKPVVLTFDDGYEDMYTHALPILQKYGMVGTFYIITGFVGTNGFLTWDQLSEMQKAGMEIGGHTVHHVFLANLPMNMAKEEIEKCKSELEKHLGNKITSFAYPFNDHNKTVEKLVEQAGYTNAVIVDIHYGDDPTNPYSIPRITVGTGESMALFARGAEKGYAGINPSVQN